jgi:hypothetical protein
VVVYFLVDHFSNYSHRFFVVLMVVLMVLIFVVLIVVVEVG